jgi:hypothetical protein
MISEQIVTITRPNGASIQYSAPNSITEVEAKLLAAAIENSTEYLHIVGGPEYKQITPSYPVWKNMWQKLKDSEAGHYIQKKNAENFEALWVSIADWRWSRVRPSSQETIKQFSEFDKEQEKNPKRPENFISFQEYLSPDRHKQQAVITREIK